PGVVAVQPGIRIRTLDRLHDPLTHLGSQFGIIVVALGQAHSNRYLVGLAELLNAGFPVAELADLLAQFGYRRFAAFDERHADHLTADEIDAQVEPFDPDQGNRRDHQQDADRVERHPPTQESDVRVVGDELEQLHGHVPTTQYPWAACGAA